MNLYIPHPLPEYEDDWIFTTTAPPEGSYIRISPARKRFGLSAVDVARMLRKQKFKCAICRGRFNHTGRVIDRYVIDHNHHAMLQGTKYCVRGLLCRSCNLIVTHNATPETLAKASAYLLASGAGFRKKGKSPRSLKLRGIQP